MIRTILTAACLCCLASVACAQNTQSSTSAWGDVWAQPDASQEQLNLNRAQAIWEMQHGGVAPVTNYNAPVTNTTNATYNGPVSSSSSTNAVNVTQSSSSVKADNSSVRVIQDNGQSSGTTTQSSGASTSAGRVIDITTSAPPPGGG